MAKHRRIWLAVGILLFAAASVHPTSAAEPKRVLLLYHSFAINLIHAKEIRAQLDRQFNDSLEIYDAPLLPPSDDKVEHRYAEYLHARFRDQRIDLAIAIGADAMNLFRRYRHRMFPSTPLVALLDQRRIPSANLTANEVAVGSSNDFAAIFENILRILPDTANVAIVIGNSLNETYWFEPLRTAFGAFPDRVSLTWFNDLSLDDMVNHAATLPPRSAIFFFTLLTDGAGAVHDEEVVLSKLRAAANAPIFSWYDTYFGKGIVGGPLISVQARAEKVANVAVRILQGEVPGEIRVRPDGLGTPKFDWRELHRWGIGERRLLPGSEIYFRDPTAWEQYRLQISVITTAIILQAALISWLLYERRYRRRAETAVRDARSELIQMNRMAAAGELSASIAHEINQPLTGIVANASAARRWLSREGLDIDKIKGMLDQIERAADHATSVIKNLRRVFKRDTTDKAEVDINKLILAVLALGKKEIEKHQIKVEIELDDQLPNVVGNEVQLLQVVLNLVMNATEAMHSVQSRILRIQSRRSKSNTVNVSIEDTGTGINPSEMHLIFKPLFTTKATGMGMGLSICHSIVESHNGRIWVSEGVDRGSIFQFELPITMGKS